MCYVIRADELQAVCFWQSWWHVGGAWPRHSSAQWQRLWTRRWWSSITSCH